MSRLSERDTRAGATKKGRFSWRPSNVTIAVVFLLIVTIGPYLAFTKHVPFTSYGYELKATFSNGVNISKNSPVRIAGVEVGKVITAERDGDATVVRFTVSGAGRPIHKDAFAEIRPRIFLEGNFFIELDPGSPSSPEMSSGETIPVSHTSTAVQLDQILTALQSPVRADLGRLLEGFGTALNATPTAAEDATQLPEVQGKSGGEALNGVLKYGGDAGRYGAQVSNGFLGTSPHDLSRLISGTARTFGAFTQSGGGTAAADRQLRRLHRRPRHAVQEPRKHDPPLRAGAEDRAHLSGQPQQDPAAAALLRDRADPRRRRAPRPDRGGRTVDRTGPPAGLRQGGGGHRQAPRRSDARPCRRRPGRQGRRPAPAQPAQPLRLEGPDPDRQRDGQRPLQHRRPQLPRVPLRAHRFRRAEPELRRQRPLLPDSAGRRQPPGRRAEPGTAT